MLVAEAAFFGSISVAVDKKYVWFQALDILSKVHDSASGVYESIFHIAYGLDHVETFTLGIDGFAVLQVVYRAIGAYAYIEVAV